MRDFFWDDYFFDKWGGKSLEMKEMMSRTDSTRNAFLKRYNSGPMESNKKD